jgi:hypothetical protein
MKNAIIILSILCFGLSASAQKMEKTYKVLASCGICQFDMNTKNGCELAILYGEKKYLVDGSSLQDHGDEHDPEGGMCEKIRKAEVKGTFKEDKFLSTSFVLLTKRKKKTKTKKK